MNRQNSVPLKISALIVAAAMAAMAVVAGCAAPPEDHAAHAHKSSRALAARSAHSQADDSLIMIRFPEMMRTHTLTNMRDHLLAVTEIQDALARGAYDKAATSPSSAWACRLWACTARTTSVSARPSHP